MSDPFESPSLWKGWSLKQKLVIIIPFVLLTILTCASFVVSSMAFQKSNAVLGNNTTRNYVHPNCACKELMKEHSTEYEVVHPKSHKANYCITKK